VRDGGRLASTFGVVDIGSNGRPAMGLGKAEAARRVEGRCGIGSAWRGLQWRARVVA
jgi:hypothetical protein